MFDLTVPAHVSFASAKFLRIEVFRVFYFQDLIVGIWVIAERICILKFCKDSISEPGFESNIIVQFLPTSV